MTHGFSKEDLLNYSDNWQQAIERYETTTGYNLLEEDFYAELRGRSLDKLVNHPSDKLASAMIKFNESSKPTKDRSSEIDTAIRRIDRIVDAVHRTQTENAKKSARIKLVLFTAIGLLLQATGGSKRAYIAINKLIYNIAPLYKNLQEETDETSGTSDDVWAGYKPMLTELLHLFGLLTVLLRKDSGTLLKRFKELVSGSRISSEELAKELGRDRKVRLSLQQIARSAQREDIFKKDEFWAEVGRAK